MSNAIDIQEFLAAAEELTIFDVRSPGEFASGHIPGAKNVPLFSDEERAKVGTCYVQESREEAVLLGLEIVGPKMRSIAEQVSEAVSPDERLLVHCWRGGMRSSSVCWLLEQTGLCPDLLEGGYKSFRRAAQADFAVAKNYIVLSGMTGAGKTLMLEALAEKGEQVLDLEGLANHRGSSFGAIGLPPQPTCEQFENDVYMRLRSFDHARPIWVEDESPSIGRVRVPDSLWGRMRESPAIFMDASRETRAENLAKEYGALDKSLLEDATRRLERKLGGLRMSEILQDLERGKMVDVAFRLLEYYDKSYQHAATRQPREHVFRLDGSLGVAEVIRLGAKQCAQHSRPANTTT